MSRSSPLSLVGSPRLAPGHEANIATGPGPRKCRKVSPAVERFRKARLALGLTQAMVAGLFKVARRTVIAWETEETALPAWALVELEARVAQLGAA